MTNLKEKRPEKVLKDTLKQLGKRWFLCVVFGFDLLILVTLSEAIRSMIIGLSPNSYSLGNWVTVFFWIFILVPLVIVPLWYFSPYATKKLLVTFGLGEESPIVEKSETEKKPVTEKRGLLLSKWFYYGLIAVVLLILTTLSLYGISLGYDIALRFLPTLGGLWFTLGIFYVFFDVRERLEWKSVETKVMKGIEGEIDSIFIELSLMCEVNMVFFGEAGMTEEAIKKRNEDELARLATNLELNQHTVDEIFEKGREGLASELASYFDKHRILLSEIEMKYSKFLNPQLQTALMEIQEYLGCLRRELRVMPMKKERFHKDLSEIIGKILKAMNEVNNKLKQ